MRKFYLFILITLMVPSHYLLGQDRKALSDSLKLFYDEKPLRISIITDLKKLLKNKSNQELIGAEITWHMPDSSVITERIRLRARGKTRREMCAVPPLKLDFHNETSPKLYRLDEIEITHTCRPGGVYEQLVYKEFLVYKMYNLITEKSQRARLVDLILEDSLGQKKSVSQPAFIIEELDDVAKRNKCKQVKIDQLHSENTDRAQMAVVALFEYMIGNTDWSVYANHNIKLISDKDSLLTKKPYAVAYDFDYSGIVNAPYAVPDEMLGIQTVTERVYRGFQRTLEELQEAAKIFIQKKDSIYGLISNCQYLNDRSKKEMTGFLNGFYDTLESPKKMKREFIDNAKEM